MSRSFTSAPPKIVIAGPTPGNPQLVKGGSPGQAGHDERSAGRAGSRTSFKIEVAFPSADQNIPGVGEDRVVVVRVAAGAVEIGGGAVEFVPQDVLQSDAHVQPWPEGGAAVSEGDGGDFRNPAGAVRAARERAVKRCIRG